MKVIYRIAKTELQMLFYSPIAWLLLICFVIQTGIIFSGLFGDFVREMEEYGHAWRASRTLFAVGDHGLGLWPQVLNFLYFYIPLLTMGMVSRDLGSGSIKLLYSSPISSTQIILGKFLCMVFYALILVAVLCVYLIVGWSSIEDFEAGWVLCGLLGVFLVVCTYMAVGIFMSSLTTYQIIAAVGTFIILMLLNMVGSWGQGYDFVREITYWLSINGRAGTFISGMLCSEDVIYFPAVIAMFLALTIIRLNAVRQKQRFVITCGKNTIVIVVVCVIAFVSSRPSLIGYYDATHTKLNTLTPVSQDIIKQVEGGMTITSYVNVLDRSYSTYRFPGFIMQNQRYFRQYTRFKPEIELKTVYYYAEPDNDLRSADPTGEKTWAKAKYVCEIHDLDSMMLKNQHEIDQMVDLSEEGYTFIRQIVRENGQKDWLRVYDYGLNKQPEEAEISVALKRMVMELPKIGFVSGHREASIYDKSPMGYNFIAGNKKVQFSVWNQGFDVEDITLDKPIPEDIDYIIIADPREAYSEYNEAILQAYLDRGGNMLFLGEPRHREALNPTLRKLFGVELTPLLVSIDKENQVTPEITRSKPTKVAKDLMYELGKVWLLANPTYSGVEVVENKGFESFPVTLNDTTALCWTELETTDFIDDTVKFDPAVGEECKVFTTVMGLTRKVGDKEQRIIISGDSDILSNNAFMTNNRIGSLSQVLILGSSYWMSYGKAPLDVRRPATTDNKVFMSVGTYSVLEFMIRWIFPFLLIGIYFYLWLRRRGR